MEKRYWLDTNYIFGDFTVAKWALHEVTTSEDGNEEDEIIVYAAYEDTPGFPEETLDGKDVDQANRAIDSYIESELGFLPEYEIG